MDAFDRRFAYVVGVELSKYDVNDENEQRPDCQSGNRGTHLQILSISVVNSGNSSTIGLP